MIPAINSPVFRAFDINGKPLVGGKLYSYASGTLNPQPTFTDSTNNVPNANPTILDSTGQSTVFMGASAYKFILKDSAGVTQWTADNITQASGGTGQNFIGGVWSGVSVYLVGAVVQYGTGFYLGIAGSVGVIPGTDTTIWVLINGSTSPFTITSFTGGSSFEIGHSVINPVFAASYSVAPTSAAITNTDAIDSPHNLVAPYTSVTLAGTFAHSTAATVTFTLTAVGSSTQTATQPITWSQRIFGGIGTPGATAMITTSGTTATLSTGDILAGQLGAETVGQILGPYVPSGQSVYLILVGGSHTFIDNGTGFPFAFNAPVAVTFVNSQGLSVNGFKYESTNALFGTFNVKVAS